MPTQCLSRERAGALLAAGPAFVDAPADQQVAHGLAAGTVTDDTAQALVTARLLVAGRGRIAPRRLAEELLAWEDAMTAAGSLDLLGPSTKAALAAVRAGADPATTGRAGTTNGAAMRVAPVGIATAAEPLAALVDAVVAAGSVTHDTGTAHAGAAAVAAVVSAGIDGATFAQALPIALAAARAAASRGHRPDTADVAGRIEAAVGLVHGRDRRAGADVVLDRVSAQVGTSLATHESVPAAFAVAAMAPDDGWRAAWYGGRLGGDADTIAAMAGAMVAACAPDGLPPAALAVLLAVNPALAEVPALVDGLLALRRAR